MNSKIYGYKQEGKHRHVDRLRQTDRQTDSDRQIDRQTQTDRQTDRQTQTEVERGNEGITEEYQTDKDLHDSKKILGPTNVL